MMETPLWRWLFLRDSFYKDLSSEKLNTEDAKEAQRITEKLASPS
jgi:hypothetical protein